MPAQKIRFLLELLLILLAVTAPWLFPRLGVPNQLSQTIAFTASVILWLLAVIRKWRLPPTATMEEQSGASFAILPCFTFAFIALDRTDEGLSKYGNLFLLLMIGTLIILLCERFALRRRSNV